MLSGWAACKHAGQEEWEGGVLQFIDSGAGAPMGREQAATARLLFCLYFITHFLILI